MKRSDPTTGENIARPRLGVHPNSLGFQKSLVNICNMACDAFCDFSEFAEAAITGCHFSRG